MVIAGKKSPVQASVARVAAATLDVLGQTVPAACAGIAFLSGGQGNELATQHLDAMNRQDARLKKWPLTFSYGRALQQPTLETWARDQHDIVGAQRLLAHRARCNSRATFGAYQFADEEMTAQLA
jgi:fructose-bisphosphate aldolase class I